MPIDYKKYCADWKLRSKFIRFYRAKNKCEFCGVDNYKAIVRCTMGNLPVYYDWSGILYDANNSKIIPRDVFNSSFNKESEKAIKVVLTTAHLDHDLKNNSFFNLKALCQKCHLNYDRKNNNMKKGNRNQLEMFENGGGDKNNYEVLSL